MISLDYLKTLVPAQASERLALLVLLAVLSVPVIWNIRVGEHYAEAFEAALRFGLAQFIFFVVSLLLFRQQFVRALRLHPVWLALVALWLVSVTLSALLSPNESPLVWRRLFLTMAQPLFFLAVYVLAQRVPRLTEIVLLWIIFVVLGVTLVVAGILLGPRHEWFMPYYRHYNSYNMHQLVALVALIALFADRIGQSARLQAGLVWLLTTFILLVNWVLFSRAKLLGIILALAVVVVKQTNKRVRSIFIVAIIFSLAGTFQFVRDTDMKLDFVLSPAVDRSLAIFRSPTDTARQADAATPTVIETETASGTDTEDAPRMLPGQSVMAESPVQTFTTGRTRFWQIAMDGFWQSPWFGLGPEAYHFLEQRYFGSQPHNLLVRILLEWGVIGTLPALLLLCGLYWKVVRTVVAAPKGHCFGLSPAITLLAFVPWIFLDGIFYNGVSVTHMLVLFALVAAGAGSAPVASAEPPR